ncbi:MAG: hypothetical protein ACT4OO_06935 [Nitrospiraceae bacterium]
MKAGIVFLKTPVGLLTLSSKTCLRDLRGSQDVTLWINGTQSMVEIRKRGDASVVHRYLTGELRYATADKDAITLWTPDGEKTFSVGTQQSKLVSHAENTPITVEVDDGGKLLGLHDLEYDLQVSQAPHASSDTRIMLRGTISKLKSNFVFLKTPVGMVTVSSKTGVRNVKVGQDMVLWVHDANVVVDIYQKGRALPTRRFFSGRWAYASPDKRAITLWAPEGIQTFPAERGHAILSSLKEGVPITVETNQQGTVVEIRALS